MCLGAVAIDSPGIEWLSSSHKIPVDSAALEGAAEGKQDLRWCEGEKEEERNIGDRRNDADRQNPQLSVSQTYPFLRILTVLGSTGQELCGMIS